MTARRVHRVVWAALAAVVLAAAPAWTQPAAGLAGDRPVGTTAIVPFANLSGGPVDDWMGRGIAEALGRGADIVITGRVTDAAVVCGPAAWHHRWATDDWDARLAATPLSPAMLAPQFMGNLAALHGLLSEVKAHQWLQQPDPDEWSIMQILCHLEDTETSVHQARLRAIAEQDNPFIRALPPPGPHLPPCHDDGHAVMASFHRERLATMDLLDALKPDEWRRPARHSIFGLTTLMEMAYFTAQHDRLHINQLCQTLGKCVD